MLDDLQAEKAVHWSVGYLAWRATTEPIRNAAQRHLIDTGRWPVVRGALVGLINTLRYLQLGHESTPLTVHWIARHGGVPGRRF